MTGKTTSISINEHITSSPNGNSKFWRSYLRHLLKPYGGLFFFHCNYNINDYHINSTFYSEMLQWWSEFRSNVSTDSKAYDSIIWNNCNIKIDGKPICYHNYMNAGVIFISDLMYSRNNVESFNTTKDKGLMGSNGPFAAGVT